MKINRERKQIEVCYTAIFTAFISTQFLVCIDLFSIHLMLLLREKRSGGLGVEKGRHSTRWQCVLEWSIFLARFLTLLRPKDPLSLSSCMVAAIYHFTLFCWTISTTLTVLILQLVRVFISSVWARVWFYGHKWVKPVCHVQNHSGKMRLWQNQ